VGKINTHALPHNAATLRPLQS